MEWYEFYYPHSNVRQRKVLIPNEVYLEYKRIDKDIGEDEAKQYLRQFTGGNEFFTEKSQYYEAIATGILDANGRWECIVKKVE